MRFVLAFSVNPEDVQARRPTANNPWGKWWDDERGLR
jgi:hypothetical protein